MDSKNSTGSILKVVGIVILNFIPSVIIPVIFDYNNWVSRSEAILLGILISILLTCSVILYKTDILNVKQKQETALWSVQNNLDARLLNIRENYRTILATRNNIPDLYQNTFDDRVAELEKAIFEAATRDELHIREGHVVSTNLLLSSFKGKPTDVFRPIHLLEDNDWFFDVLAKQYFYQVYELVSQKKIKEVKRLMLYNDERELKDPRSVGLMRFHAVTPDYSYKIMKQKAFRQMLADCRLAVPRDFGIYGSNYIYIAQINKMDNLVGYYRKNPETIAAYIRFFETCWNSPAATTLETVDTSSKMTLEELFKLRQE